MAPAFSSARQALAFAALLVLLIGLPALATTDGRQDVYSAIPWKHGSFPWVQQKLFDERSDVDIAFLGSSRIWCAIHPPTIAAQLAMRLKRRAEVFSLGWPWPGFDAVYTVARDLLSRRKVRMLVIYDEAGPDAPHLNASRWYQLEDTRGLAWRSRLALYGSAVLGMPRSLLSKLRPNRLEDPAQARTNFWNTYYQAPPVATQGGALRARLAFGIDRHYVREELPTLANTADARIFQPATRADFTFVGPKLLPYQQFFAEKLGELCALHGTRLVVLHTPRLSEGERPTIAEAQDWTRVLGPSVEIVGVPPARLFAGLSPAQRAKLFYEDAHLNEMGQDLFTRVVTPALIELHDQAPIPH